MLSQDMIVIFLAMNFQGQMDFSLNDNKNNLRKEKYWLDTGYCSFKLIGLEKMGLEMQASVEIWYLKCKECFVFFF